ncbi:hypothetical protein SGPA1_30495 [Streptomyces misionensis JCM 4497]
MQRRRDPAGPPGHRRRVPAARPGRAGRGRRHRARRRAGHGLRQGLQGHRGRGHPGGLGDGVPVVRHRRRRGGLPRQGRRTHPAVELRAHRGDRHHLAAGRPPVHPTGGLDHGRREHLHPVHRRRPVRLRRGDRHLHAEAARPGPDGAAGADQHQVHRHRRRARAALTSGRLSPWMNFHTVCPN